MIQTRKRIACGGPRPIFFSVFDLLNPTKFRSSTAYFNNTLVSYSNLDFNLNTPWSTTRYNRYLLNLSLTSARTVVSPIFADVLFQVKKYITLRSVPVSTNTVSIRGCETTSLRPSANKFIDQISRYFLLKKNDRKISNFITFWFKRFLGSEKSF